MCLNIEDNINRQTQGSREDFHLMKGHRFNLFFLGCDFGSPDLSLKAPLCYLKRIFIKTELFSLPKIQQLR